MTIELIIDNREQALIKLLTLYNVEFKVDVLEIGDVVFRDSNEVVFVIERKSINDLKASICDGRHREQKARLMNCGLDKSRILFVIEGKIDKQLGEMISGVSVSTILGSLINTQLRDDIKVYKTVSLEETALFIKLLYHKLQADITKFFLNKQAGINDANYAATLRTKKKDNVTPSVWFIHQLSSIPQVTEKIASVIVDEYGSVKNLIVSYESVPEENRLKLLSNLSYPIANGKTRRVGDKVSERIYKLIYGIC
jgi:crossover junction endonuclease MUS81